MLSRTLMLFRLEPAVCSAYLRALFDWRTGSFIEEANDMVKDISAAEVSLSDYFGLIDFQPQTPFEWALKRKVRGDR